MPGPSGSSGLASCSRAASTEWSRRSSGELFGQRSEADYETSDISFAEAARAVADAQRIVDAVEEWIAGRG